MSKIVCSKDECPLENVKKEKTINCFTCNSIVHLMCIGINVDAVQLLWNKHMKIICESCLSRTFSPPSKRKQTKNNSNSPSITSYLSTKNTKQNEKTPNENNTIIEQMDWQNTNVNNNEILSSIQRCVNDNNKQLKEIKNSINNLNSNKPQNTPSFRDILKSQTKSAAVSSAHPMYFRNRIASTSSNTSHSPKINRIKHNNLISGTNSNINGDLGDAVIIKQKTTKNQRFEKSIYVSRLHPSVDVDKMSSYVINNSTNLKKDDFSLHLLVKRDQRLDDLNFISFRLSCNTDLYESLIKPEFWPSHVLIGDFIIRDKSNQSPLKQNSTSFLSSPQKKDLITTEA